MRLKREMATRMVDALRERKAEAKVKEVADKERAEKDAERKRKRDEEDATRKKERKARVRTAYSVHMYVKAPTSATRRYREAR
eukprot:gene2221-3564_t